MANTLKDSYKKICIFDYIYFGVSAIVIQVDSKSKNILSELAKKLGGKVLSIDDNQYEDIALGNLMDK